MCEWIAITAVLNFGVIYFTSNNYVNKAPSLRLATKSKE